MLGHTFYIFSCFIDNMSMNETACVIKGEKPELNYLKAVCITNLHHAPLWFL